MSDFLIRQLNIFLNTLTDYKANKWSLNSLVQRSESIIEVFKNKSLVPNLADELNDIVCDVEVINAVALDQGKDLSDEEIEEVNSMVLRMEKLVSTELSSIKVDEED